MRGWSTLSIQMPVLDKQASYYEYEDVFPEAIPRIDAAIHYLQAQGTQRIALISHSCGVHMSMTWVEQRGTDGIDAYIGIGMGATDYKQPMRQPFPYDSIKVPLLNVVGSEDYPAVQLQAETLESILEDLPAGSAQRRIEGAGHYFDDQNEELLEVITEWLEQTIAPGG
jgi:dienelactone hydrolase